MKQCRKCNQLKDLNNFHKSSRNADGLRHICKACRSEETKLYREKHREKVLLKKKEWYKTTKIKSEKRTEDQLSLKNKICSECGLSKDILSFRQRANGGFYSKCRSCENAINKIYRKNNPDIINANKVISEQKRRKKSENLKSDFTKAEWKDCKNFFNNKCAYCGKKMSKLTQDHFIPLSKGGEYTKTNIIPSCRSCNSRKHDKDFNEWYIDDIHFSNERKELIEKYLKSLK